MFDNIGNKIKVLAQVVCIVGIIISFLMGMGVFLDNDDLFIVGFFTALLGSLSSWIGCFVIYGFGEMIERLVSIDNKLAGGNIASGANNKLEMLKKWKDLGLITSEEYESKMKQLMEGYLQ